MKILDFDEKKIELLKLKAASIREKCLVLASIYDNFFESIDAIDAIKLVGCTKQSILDGLRYDACAAIKIARKKQLDKLKQLDDLDDFLSLEIKEFGKLYYKMLNT